MRREPLENGKQIPLKIGFLLCDAMQHERKEVGYTRKVCARDYYYFRSDKKSPPEHFKRVGERTTPNRVTI